MQQAVTIHNLTFKTDSSYNNYNVEGLTWISSRTASSK